MSRTKCSALAVCVAIALGGAVRADVKSEEKSLVKFEGMLGRMVGLFGGKAAREGIVTRVAVKGDRKLTMSDSGGQIIDLAEEKVYELDTKNKTYKVTTFAEMRRQLEEARRKATEQAARQSNESKEQPAAKDPNQKEYEIDFDVKESGQKKAVNGFDAREIVMTVAVREKGKTLEQSGGIVLTSNSWLAPKMATMKEVAEFDLKYAQKLNGPLGYGDAATMAAALAMYPGLAEAMKKFQAENVNLDGTPVQTVVTFQAVKNAEQMAAEKDQKEERPAGIGGMLGGLAGRMRKKDDSAAQPSAAPTAPNRATIMTMTHDVLKVSPDVAAADVAIPAGYKEK